MGIAIDKEEVRTLVKQYRRILKQSNASSISNTKPIVSESPRTNISPYMKNTEKYKELILEHGPYFHFITLTFHPKTGFKKKCQYTDFLCHLLNQELFSQKYKERGQYMEGFAFFEDHLSCHFDNPVHIHILIKHNDKYYKKTSTNILNFFTKPLPRCVTRIIAKCLTTSALTLSVLKMMAL